MGPVPSVRPLLLTLVLVPVSTQSGEALQERVKDSSLISTHAGLAEGLLPWAFGLFIVAAVMLWLEWSEQKATSARAPRWVALALAVTAVLAATGTTVQAVRVGHSGATAVWSQVAASATTPGTRK